MNIKCLFNGKRGFVAALAAVGLIGSATALAFQDKPKTGEIPVTTKPVQTDPDGGKKADQPVPGQPAKPGQPTPPLTANPPISPVAPMMPGAPPKGEPQPSVPVDPNNPPKVTVVSGETHDFGTTWAGEPLQHSFVLKNEGTGVLEILSVKPGCGCTAAGSHPKKIEPGQTGEFPFTLNSTKLHAAYTKNITVTTNDPAKPKLDLKLAGTCKAFVELTPPQAYFQKLFGDEPAETVIKIVNNTETPLTLTLPAPKEKAQFAYTLVETTPGKAYDLTVKAVPPFAEGSVKDQLDIVTNVEKLPKLEIPVTGRVPKRLEVTPPSLVLTKASKESTRPINFKNEGKNPVKVLSATSSDPALGAELPVVEKKAGEEYVVNVMIPANYAPPKGGTKITLKTDDAQSPEIVIPITEREVAKPQPRPQESMVGKPSPSYNLTTMDGKPLSNDTQKDQVTILNFWAGNCGFCKKQMPRLETLRKEYEGKPVRFVMVQQTMRTPMDQAQIKEIVDGLGFKGEVALDPDNKIGPLFSANSFPSLFVLGKDGKVASARIGNIADLETVLKNDIETQLDPVKAAAAAAEAAKKAAEAAANPAAAAAAPTVAVQPTDGAPRNVELKPVDPKDLPPELIEKIRKAEEEKAKETAGQPKKDGN